MIKIMNIKEGLYKYHQRTTALKAKGTIKFEAGHIVSLNKCFDALGIVTTSDITLDSAYRIINWYRAHTNNSNNSINKRLAHLKRVLKYFKIETDFYEVEYLKKDTNPYQRFQANELKIIFKAIDMYVDSPNSTKNSKLYQLMIYMLLDTGLRISELLEIKIQNIDLVNQVIFLEHTKNGKKEPIPFSSFSSTLLSEVIELNYHDEWLFYNVLKDRKMNYQNDVRNFMRRFQEKTNLNVHPHRFRKSYGTLIYQKTQDIRLVQRLLRHSRTSTTELYIQEGIEETHRRYHDAASIFKTIK